MDAGGDLGSAAKGSAIARSGGCWLWSGWLPCFHSLLFLTMCNSLTCLSFFTMVRRPSSLVIGNKNLVFIM